MIKEWFKDEPGWCVLMFCLIVSVTSCTVTDVVRDWRNTFSEIKNDLK